MKNVKMIPIFFIRKKHLHSLISGQNFCCKMERKCLAQDIPKAKQIQLNGNGELIIKRQQNKKFRNTIKSKDHERIQI